MTGISPGGKLPEIAPKYKMQRTRLIPSIKTYIVFSDESTFSGELVDKKMHGKGNIRFSDGDILYANWKAGRIRAGIKYIIKPDHMNPFSELKMIVTGYEDMGTGMIRFPDRTIFCGSWRNGKMHGNGQLLLSNGKLTNKSWDEGIIQRNSNQSPIIQGNNGSHKLGLKFPPTNSVLRVNPRWRR